jgi:hypothetical protein
MRHSFPSDANGLSKENVGFCSILDFVVASVPRIIKIYLRIEILFHQDVMDRLFQVHNDCLFRTYRYHESKVVFSCFAFHITSAYGHCHRGQAPSQSCTLMPMNDIHTCLNANQSLNPTRWGWGCVSVLVTGPSRKGDDSLDIGGCKCLNHSDTAVHRSFGVPVDHTNCAAVNGGTVPCELYGMQCYSAAGLDLPASLLELLPSRGVHPKLCDISRPYLSDRIRCDRRLCQSHCCPSCRSPPLSDC